MKGHCDCIEGFKGESCEERWVLRGKVIKGGEDVICEEGWHGLACNSMLCVENCNKKGICNNGTCVCDKMWSGESCNF